VFDCTCNTQNSLLLNQHNGYDAPQDKIFVFTINLFHPSTCFEHTCSSSGGQNCITQPLVSSHWN